MATRICRGTAVLDGVTNIVKINYSGFSGVPTITATVVDSLKNGNNVTIRNKTTSSADLVAFYNGGLMLIEGKIDWIAIGPCPDKMCPCMYPPHKCSIATVYAG